MACGSPTFPSTATPTHPSSARTTSRSTSASPRCWRASSPDFSEEDVVDWTVQRAPLVEPVHALGHEPRTAPGVARRWRVSALASASQIYPRLLNGESVVELAERVAGEALERTRRHGASPERDTVSAAAPA